MGRLKPSSTRAPRTPGSGLFRPGGERKRTQVDAIYLAAGDTYEADVAEVAAGAAAALSREGIFAVVSLTRRAASRTAVARRFRATSVGGQHAEAPHNT